VPPLEQRLQEIRAVVEDRLRAVLKPQPAFPAALREAVEYSLLAPGKRLRPALVVLAAEACGREAGDPWPAAGAVEMIHAYSLIHDDLPAMDDDDLRRGQPTCHKKFGEALAILAGDTLQTLAFQTLAEGYPPPTAAACVLELARGAGPCGMIGGQVDDIRWEKSSPQYSVLSTPYSPPAGSQTDDLLAGLESLHARKTGALIRASLRMGMWAAHAPQAPTPELLERFDGYGRRVGLAFQIVDDLLDVEGSLEQTGKRVGKDAARGKLTYPGLLGPGESRRRAERLCREAVDLIAPLGPAADSLRALAAYVLERDR
jgi:geranylgeranyl diphosphate synthase type II